MTDAQLLIIANIIDSMHDMIDSKSRIKNVNSQKTMKLPSIETLLQKIYGSNIISEKVFKQVLGESYSKTSVTPMKRKLYDLVLVQTSGQIMRYAPKVQHIRKDIEHSVLNLPPSMFMKFLELFTPYIVMDSFKARIGTELIDVLFKKQFNKSVFQKRRLLTIGQLIDPANNITSANVVHDDGFALYLGPLNNGIQLSNYILFPIKSIHQQFVTKFEFFVLTTSSLAYQSIRMADDIRNNRAVNAKHLVEYQKIKRELAIVVKCVHNGKTDYMFINRCGFKNIREMYDAVKVSLKLDSVNIVHKLTDRYDPDSINLFDFTSGLSGMSMNFAMNMHKKTVESRSLLYWLDLKRMGDSLQIQLAREIQDQLFKTNETPLFFFSHDVLACIIALMNRVNVVCEQRGTYLVFFAEHQKYKKQESRILKQDPNQFKSRVRNLHKNNNNNNTFNAVTAVEEMSNKEAQRILNSENPELSLKQYLNSIKESTQNSNEKDYLIDLISDIMYDMKNNQKERLTNIVDQLSINQRQLYVQWLEKAQKNRQQTNNAKSHRAKTYDITSRMVITYWFPQVFRNKPSVSDNNSRPTKQMKR